MEYADWNKQNELATKQVGKFSVYVRNGLQFDDNDIHIWSFIADQLQKMFGGIDSKDYLNYIGCLIDGGLFFFESSDKAFDFFLIFEQELTYSSAIYACVYSPIDGCLNDNT